MVRKKGDYLPKEVIPFHLEVHMKLDDGEEIHGILTEGLQYYPKDPLLNYLLAWLIHKLTKTGIYIQKQHRLKSY